MRSSQKKKRNQGDAIIFDAMSRVAAPRNLLVDGRDAPYVGAPVIYDEGGLRPKLFEEPFTFQRLDILVIVISA